MNELDITFLGVAGLILLLALFLFLVMNYIYENEDSINADDFLRWKEKQYGLKNKTHKDTLC